MTKLRENKRIVKHTHLHTLINSAFGVGVFAGDWFMGSFLEPNGDADHLYDDAAIRMRKVAPEMSACDMLSLKDILADDEIRVHWIQVIMPHSYLSNFDSNYCKYTKFTCHAMYGIGV